MNFKIGVGALALLISGPVIAADLPSRSAAPIFAAPSAYSWTGFYGGLQAGGAINMSRWASPVGLFSTFDNTGGSLIGGAHAGFNWQMNQFFVGVEGQANATNIRDAAGSSRTRQNWLVDANLRAGLALNRTLFYGTGGVAFTEYHLEAVWPGLGGAQSWNVGSRTGWTIGLGLDYSITDNWVAGVQYKYYDFGTISSISTAGNPVRFRETEHTVLARLSYMWSTPAAAVVAKY